MNRRTVLTVALLVLVHWTTALFVGGSLHLNTALSVVLAGWCVGQINLIAVWGALTPGRVLLRVPWSIVLGLFLWYALVLGNRLDLQPDRIAMWLRLTYGPTAYYRNELSLNDAILLGALLLAAVLCLQIPLWVAARLWGWRLLSPTHEPSAPRNERQIHMRHLLLGVTIASVAFAMARVVLPAGRWQMMLPLAEEFLLLIIVGIVNLTLVVPCIWWATLKMDAMLPILFGWLFFSVLVSMLEVFGIGVIWGRQGTATDVTYVYIGLFNLAQCVCVFVSLFVLRGAGFRLLQVDARNAPRLPPPTREIVTRE